MGKPSIFSQNYDNSMKRRKRKKLFTIIMIMLIIVGGTFYIYKNLNLDDLRGMVKGILKDEERVEIGKTDENENVINEISKKPPVEEEDKTETDIKDKEEKQDANVEDKENEVENKADEKEKDGISVEYIGVNKEAMVTLEIKDVQGVKTIEHIEDNEKVFADKIKDMAVVNILESQNTYIVKSDKSVIDITFPAFISSKKKKYEKEYVMKNYKEFIWCGTPRFIDDKAILYVSDLPWISNERPKYLWIYNIETGKHRALYSLYGEKIDILDRLEGKIKVRIDGKEIFIDSKGNKVK